MEENRLLSRDIEYKEINQVYVECLDYLTKYTDSNNVHNDNEPKELNVIQNGNICKEEPGYETIKDIMEKDKDDLLNISDKTIGNANNPTQEINEFEMKDRNSSEKHNFKELAIKYKVENEIRASESLNSMELRSARLRKLSKQLPKIIITQSNTSLELKQGITKLEDVVWKTTPRKASRGSHVRKPQSVRRAGYGEFPKRLVSKSGLENVAVISNVPFEKIRLLNDTFHTLINLRWRWIVMGTVVVHFLLWLVFAVFWYITALAHYDFEPNPPNKTCVTGGKDFVTIFLASVEAQTTIGFGDRAIDEECPESIFLFITQLILGTGLSGVLTCAVYAKLTRPEKLSRDGVGFSKKAVISMRDGRLCLMMRAWDLNYDHIISSEFTAHFVNTRRTKEGEVIRYYARRLPLQQRQFLLWPVTLVHIIDEHSPLYTFTPEHFIGESYEITLTLKGASASMGTYTQSQTSYLPRELVWGHRFPAVVKYDARKQKYVIDHKKLDTTDPVDTPYCSASQLYSAHEDKVETLQCPATPSSFSEKITTFQLERSSSFKRKNAK